MATDVAPRADASEPVVVTPRAVQRRRGVVLLAAAAFNLWLWVTRIRNLVADVGDVSTAFVAVHAGLYVAALVVAVVVGVVGWRLWHEARRRAAEPPA